MYNDWEMLFDFILPSDQFTVYFTRLLEIELQKQTKKENAQYFPKPHVAKWGILHVELLLSPKAQTEISCLVFVFLFFLQMY